MHSLLLIALAGFPVEHATIVPGTNKRISDAETLGIVFSAELPPQLCKSWRINSRDYRLLYFPLAFAEILLLDKPLPFKKGHPLFVAWKKFRLDLLSSFRIHRVSYQSFEEIICQHLSYRATVAQVLAHRDSAASIPLYELVGALFRDDLIGVKCPSRGLPVKYSGSVTSEFSSATVGEKLRTRSTVEISLASFPAVVHTAGQKNPVDGVLSVRGSSHGAAQSSILRFWLSFKFSSGGKDASVSQLTESESGNVKLAEFLQDLSSNSKFSSSCNYGLIVTNRSIPHELHEKLWRSKILIVGGKQLENLLSPTLASVLVFNQTKENNS